MSRVHKIKNHFALKTATAVLPSIIAFAAGTNLCAENLADAAARASAWTKRPIAASPHALEDFSWAFSGANPPRRVQMPQIYPGNPFEMAAKASTWANRPIDASPHALEEFPWVLHGFPPPQPRAPSDWRKD